MNQPAANDLLSNGASKIRAQELPATQRTKRVALISIALALVTFAVFGRTVWERFSFVDFDDQVYVSDNEVVRRGLTWSGVRWAFDPKTSVVSNWHPVTMLSHMADCQLYGLEAWGHHLTNVVWHTANVLLLFWLLIRMTGAVWRSALVAALFSWHPLHVESVAWIAERKDVLSTFFWFLTLWAYTFYIRRRTWWTYLPIALWLTIGLMCKPMLVTLPFVLLLLDYWPLGQFQLNGQRDDKRRLAARVLEKLPLLAIVGVACAATLAVQTKARIDWVRFPLQLRLANAAESYVAYLSQTLWPTELAVPYLLSARGVGMERGILFAAALVVAVCVLLSQARSRPYLTVGGFWYLGTLVPTIGLVQVGVQAMADRYTYVPLVGIFIMIAWGLAELVDSYPRMRIPAISLAVAWLALLAALSYQQVGHWRNKVALFRHAVAVTEANHVALMALGSGLRREGNLPEALEQLDRAVNSAPLFPLPRMRKAHLLYEMKRYRDAALEFAEAVRLSNNFSDRQQDFIAAVVAAQILSSHPDEASRNAAVAVEMAEHACKMTDNKQAQALDALAMAYANVGRFPEAIELAQLAQQLASSVGAADYTDKIGKRLALYRQALPYREPPGPSTYLLPEPDKNF